MTDKNIITIESVSCYEQDGTAYLKLEDVARGLGFTQTMVTPKGRETFRLLLLGPMSDTKEDPHNG